MSSRTSTARRDRRAELRPLAGLLAANVVSVVGGAMSLIALPWFVFDTTGSSALTGIVALCEVVPVLVMSFFAGSVVARLGARRTRVWSDVVSGVAVLSIPALHATTGIDFWLLLVLVAVNGSLRTPAVAASLVLLRDLSSRASVSRERATGVYFASVRLAVAMGGPLAGAMIALLGAPTVLVLDSATFLVSGVVVALFVPAERTPGAAAPVGPEPGATLRAGLGALRVDRPLRLLVGMAVLLAVVEAGWTSVAAPIYGQQVLQSSGALGLLFGAFGFGAVGGNLGYARLSARVSPHAILCGALVVLGGPRFVALALHLPVPALVAVTAIAGVGAGLLSPLYVNLQYDRVPARLHGHVLGLTSGLEQGGVALGVLVAGLVLTAVPVGTALLGAAALTSAAAVIVLCAPSLRGLRREERDVRPDAVGDHGTAPPGRA